MFSKTVVRKLHIKRWHHPKVDMLSAPNPGPRDIPTMPISPSLGICGGAVIDILMLPDGP